MCFPILPLILLLVGNVYCCCALSSENMIDIFDLYILANIIFLNLSMTRKASLLSVYIYIYIYSNC